MPTLRSTAVACSKTGAAPEPKKMARTCLPNIADGAPTSYWTPWLPGFPKEQQQQRGKNEKITKQIACCSCTFVHQWLMLDCAHSLTIARTR